ncbi:hypothetical protein LCGC14_2719170 [marine sediment metagenome]|uniref:Winged helix-turn helix domain-containing protein n=1 Tax=marine sediment metagenome TaxID=412755 RepID=A0A0F9BJP9_9ZZZZ
MERLQIVKSSPNHDALVELYRKEKHSRLKERYQAIFLMIELKDCKTVAELVKRSQKTIQNWVNAFNEGVIEGIIPNIPSGRPSRLSKSQMEEIKEDVLTHPRKLGYEFSNWEGKSVAHHIKQKYRVELGMRQCQYILHKLGLTLQRPRYNFPKADAEKQEEFMNDFKKKRMISIITP